MMYDTHITDLSVFLLVKLYLLIRYRNQVDLFSNQNKNENGSIRFRILIAIRSGCSSRMVGSTTSY